MGTLNKMMSVAATMMAMMNKNPFLTIGQAQNMALMQNRSYHSNKQTRTCDYSWRGSRRARSIKRRAANRKASRG